MVGGKEKEKTSGVIFFKEGPNARFVDSRVKVFVHIANLGDDTNSGFDFHKGLYIYF